MRAAARVLLAPVLISTLLGCTSRVVGCSGAPFPEALLLLMFSQALRLNRRSPTYRSNGMPAPTYRSNGLHAQSLLQERSLRARSLL